MKIHYVLIIFITSQMYCSDKTDVYGEEIGQVSYDIEHKKKADQKQCDDTQSANTTDTIQMDSAEIIYKRIKEVTRDEDFLRKTQLHQKIGGKNDKPCLIAQQISRSLFDYFDTAPLIPVAAYKQWLEINVAFEKSLFKILFEKYPEVLKQEKIASLSCALAEKWKFTELL